MLGTPGGAKIAGGDSFSLETRWACMGTRQVVTIAGAAILGLTLVSSGVRAQDLYAGIQARVPDLALMTMLVGPLEDGASCKDALEKSAAGLRDTCSTCTFGCQRCFSGSDLHGTYKKR